MSNWEASFRMLDPNEFCIQGQQFNSPMQRGNKKSAVTNPPKEDHGIQPEAPKRRSASGTPRLRSRKSLANTSPTTPRQRNRSSSAPRRLKRRGSTSSLVSDDLLEALATSAGASTSPSKEVASEQSGKSQSEAIDVCVPSTSNDDIVPQKESVKAPPSPPKEEKTTPRRMRHKQGSRTEAGPLKQDSRKSLAESIITTPKTEERKKAPRTRSIEFSQPSGNKERHRPRRASLDAVETRLRERAPISQSEERYENNLESDSKFGDSNVGSTMDNEMTGGACSRRRIAKGLPSLDNTSSSETNLSSGFSSVTRSRRNLSKIDLLSSSNHETGRSGGRERTSLIRSTSNVDCPREPDSQANVGASTSRRRLLKGGTSNDVSPIRPECEPTSKSPKSFGIKDPLSYSSHGDRKSTNRSSMRLESQSWHGPSACRTQGDVSSGKAKAKRKMRKGTAMTASSEADGLIKDASCAGNATANSTKFELRERFRNDFPDANEIPTDEELYERYKAFVRIPPLATAKDGCEKPYSERILPDKPRLSRSSSLDAAVSSQHIHKQSILAPSLKTTIVPTLSAPRKGPSSMRKIREKN